MIKLLSGIAHRSRTSGRKCVCSLSHSHSTSKARTFLGSEARKVLLSPNRDASCATMLQPRSSPP